MSVDLGSLLLAAYVEAVVLLVPLALVLLGLAAVVVSVALIALRRSS